MSEFESSDKSDQHRSEPPNGRQKEVLDHQWLEASLKEVFQPDDQLLESQIQAFVQKVKVAESSGDVGSVILPLNSSNKSAGGRKKRWFKGMVGASILGIVASLLIAFFFWSPGGSHARPESTQALLELCGRAWHNHRVRFYRVTWQMTGEQDYVADLWIKNDSQFVMKYRRMNGRMVVVGGDREKRWIVPKVGPVIVGKPGLLGSTWDRVDGEAKYLKMESLLERIPEIYRLDPFKDGEEDVDWSESSVKVYRLSAYLDKRPFGFSPGEIHSVIEAESSEVIRLILDWKDRNPFGLKVLSFQLEGYPEMDDDWFIWQKHARPKQRVLFKDKKIEKVSA